VPLVCCVPCCEAVRPLGGMHGSLDAWVQAANPICAVMRELTPHESTFEGNNSTREAHQFLHTGLPPPSQGAMANTVVPSATKLPAFAVPRCPWLTASSSHLNTVTQPPSYFCRLRPSHLSLLQSWPQSRLRGEGVALFGLAAAPDGAVARDVVVKFFVPEQALPFHSFSQVCCSK
jgi:hypothetical protein